MKQRKHDCPSCNCDIMKQYAHKLNKDGYCTRIGCNFHRKVFFSVSPFSAIFCSNQDYSKIAGYPGTKRKQRSLSFKETGIIMERKT